MTYHAVKTERSLFPRPNMIIWLSCSSPNEPNGRLCRRRRPLYLSRVPVLLFGPILIRFYPRSMKRLRILSVRILGLLVIPLQCCHCEKHRVRHGDEITIPTGRSDLKPRPTLLTCRTYGIFGLTLVDASAARSRPSEGQLPSAPRCETIPSALPSSGFLDSFDNEEVL